MQRKQKTVSIDNETSIYKEYFDYTKKNQELYGENTIVLLQVGAFFEVYGLKNPSSGEIIESKITELSEICQLNISEKKATHSNCQVLMAGFRDFTLDKYLLKLTESGYTVPVYIQEKNERNIVTRKLDKIYSTGTYISCDTDGSPKITNNIMCIWMEKFKSTNKMITTRDTIVYGVSVINIFTGKSYMFQYETVFYLNTTTFDELERYVSIYSPCEVIIISPFEGNELNSIINFSGIHTFSIHKINIMEKNTEKADKINKCSNQKYIKQILTSFYGEETYDVCSEFHNRVLATQSFCYLLNFIRERNPDLIRKISIPAFNNTSDRIILANHTLSQLNIIDDYNEDAKKHGKLSSVLSLLNKCCSPMGSRRFQYQLTNPTFDETWLNNEYNMISKMQLSNCFDNIDIFRKKIKQIRDIEKLCRQLVMKKIYPSSIYKLYKSIQLIIEINYYLIEENDICEYLCDDFVNETISSHSYITEICISIINFLEKHYILNVCNLTSSITNFDDNIIQKGVSDKLDKAIEKQKKNQDIISNIQRTFNELMQKKEGSIDTNEYIKIHETEKSGISLQITSKRSQLLKTILDNFPTKTISINDEDKNEIPIKDIKFVKSSSTNVDIDFPLLNDVCKQLLVSKDAINKIIILVYNDTLTMLENNHFRDLENLATYVSKIDVLQCKAYVSKINNYCCPIIENTNEKSFVDAYDLRHCLIEHIQQNELYVTNDVSLGKEDEKKVDGILLYGTNAVGKTSLIRALGISIIMAQSGMFVPCSRFVYKPYTAIYSRILGNDNIFKGLSTFAVEMSELRIILKMADNKSLVLGDELCSGTELQSALSIFVAGLMKLHEKETSFIFATHFHEINDYEEIRNMKRLYMKHMEVVYDREKDCLIYDRKMKDGSGPRIYGLEVCKSLYLDDEFLEQANSIRNKYYPETRGELSNKSTVYNSNKIRGTCEMCGERVGEEIHHLKQQKEANQNGFIDTIHKNHPANLMSMCERCHNNIHYNYEKQGKKPPTVRKKTTKGYILA
jgi:DNA mismatch repair protein MutS